MATSLYIHIPFCAAKCSYCSFNSYAGLQGLQERYVGALCVGLEKCVSSGDMEPLKTVFLGGGTPTLLSGKQLRRIFSAIHSSFSISADTEVSIEANPGTVDRDKLELLLASGVNRLSIGVQSFDDKELNVIGRIHSATEAAGIVGMAQKTGFTNISVDLMYGLPGQSVESWRSSLGAALSLGVQHLSLYQLTVEEGTPLETMIREDRLQLADEEAVEAMDGFTAECLAVAGYAQYEISNYAQAGYQSRHNITYWENRDYFGLGAGAVSSLDGYRRRNIADPEHYCRVLETGKSVLFEEETLDTEASFRETVIMGLRMNKGVEINLLQKRYGIPIEQYYGETLKHLQRDGLLAIRSGYLCLTDRGRVFANRVMAELV